MSRKKQATKQADIPLNKAPLGIVSEEAWVKMEGQRRKSELAHIEALIDLCIRKGIKSLNFHGIGIEIGNASTGPITPPDGNLFPDPDVDMPSDEELLNWSTPLTVVEDPEKK